MKTIGIMQPYLFPYLNYYILINLSDNFVYLNDVNFPKKKFINRNNFISNGIIKWHIPLRNISQNKLISEHYIHDFENNKKKLFTQFKQYFRNSEYFDQNIELFELFSNIKNDRIDFFILECNKILCNYLKINSKIHLSSELNINNGIENKIISICNYFDVDTYINLPGGKNIYSDIEFKKHKINLKFLKEFPIKTSILDLIFTKGFSYTSELILKYSDSQ